MNKIGLIVLNKLVSMAVSNAKTSAFIGVLCVSGLSGIAAAQTASEFYLPLADNSATTCFAHVNVLLSDATSALGVRFYTSFAIAAV